YRNLKTVFYEVNRRFPNWADQCEPHVNVLTVNKWKAQGYRIRKGEKPISLRGFFPVFKNYAVTGERIKVGTRHRPIHVFAFPQVEQSSSYVWFIRKLRTNDGPELVRGVAIQLAQSGFRGSP